GETAETRGLFLGCGMNSVGVATGGGAGMALAHAIVNGAPPMDLHEADPKRFASAFNSAAALSARVPEVLGKHYEITYPARQWSTSRDLSPTPLHAKWVAAKAHFGQVADWERPLYFNKRSEPKLTFAKPDWFDNIRQEVEQAHNSAAIFDQSTFGKIDVRGSDACTFLNRVCANDMDRPPGRAIYTAMLNERGGIESDLTAIRLSDDHYRLYVGTTAVKRDLSWLRRHVAASRVSLTETTKDFAVIGLMGPKSAEIATAVGASNLNDLGYFRSGKAHIAGCEVLGVRLSYVGESGWEITCKSEDAGAVYDALFEQGARPAGTLAQSSMRIEKRFLSYGHDLDTDISPIQSGLDFAVGWETDFVGREALQRQRDDGQENRLVSLLLEDSEAVPLGNEPVYLDEATVGKTTSAAFGYRAGKPVAIADISTAEARTVDTEVLIDIAGERFKAQVEPGAVFDPSGERMRNRSKAP
ncbi:MAG: glycine cleavage T C-terminal barrel domain-containing protein, partial [Pseudomonadota bacterium]